MAKSAARHHIYKDGLRFKKFRSRAEEDAAFAARKAEIAEDRAREAAARQAEMCEHMLAVIEACLANGVHFGAVEVDLMVCRTCNLTVVDASDVFPETNYPL